MTRNDDGERDGVAGSAEAGDVGEIVRLVAHSPSRLHQLEPLPGMRWGASGRYVIERRVGAGGMGTVYEAKDELLAKVVALKVLNRTVGSDEESNRSRILQEARLAARVEHERVARVYDVGEQEGSLFIVMEFVRGTTLRGWMREVCDPARHVMGVRHLRQIVIGIAEGLSALHKWGVIHRDLKPENVMIGVGLAIKLLDFGLARNHIDVGMGGPQAPGLHGCSGEESAVGWSGTFGYIAPERFERRALQPSVDVFALGVIIYELVTGAPPFGGDRPIAFLDATKQAPDFSLGTWGRYSNLKEVTARMLSRDPEERYSNGAEALRSLRYEIDPSVLGANRSAAAAALQGRLLWVDDEPENRGREVAVFQSMGLKVATATSTYQALAYLSREDFLAVISDMARVEGPREGYALLESMRRSGNLTPFFIYSSSDAPEHRRETANRRGQGCTSSDKELFEMVTTEVHRRQSSR